MTPLDRLTGARIPFALQHRARLAICQHVRGREVGPRWRRGSNARRADRWAEQWEGTLEPCHMCGAPGEALATWNHYEACRSCGNEWPVGDYDWWRLADVLRFRADQAAGLVEAEPASLIVHGFDVTTRDGYRAFLAACDARRDAREAGGPMPWLAEGTDRLAQFRARRAGYLDGREGVPIADDAAPDFRDGWMEGVTLWRRMLTTGMDLPR